MSILLILSEKPLDRMAGFAGCLSNHVHHVNPVLKAFGQDEQDLRMKPAHAEAFRQDEQN
jgi:hypothetical protein